MSAAVGVLVAFFLVGLLLFLGGMCEAWMEIRAEKRAGLPVTRPAWRKEDRPVKPERPDYSAPKGAGLMWVLLVIGRPDLAERYLARRGRRKISRQAAAAAAPNRKISGVSG